MSCCVNYVKYFYGNIKVSAHDVSVLVFILHPSVYHGMPMFAMYYISFCDKLSIFCFNSDDEDVCYTSVSGFVFLRFFAPAILNPKLFQMRNEHPVSDFTLQKFEFLLIISFYFDIAINNYYYLIIDFSVQSFKPAYNPLTLQFDMYPLC